MEEALIVSRLVRWAKWKLGSGAHLGFKSQVNFVRLASKSYTAYDDIDSACIEINDAVKQLPELHKLLIRVEYLSTDRTGKEKAAVLGVSGRSYISYRSAAYQRIGDYLIALRNKCTHSEQLSS